MSRMKMALGAVMFFVSACSSSPKEAGSAGTAEGGFKLRSYAEEKLDNGLRIIWIKDDTLPRVSLSLMVEVGSIDDPRGKEGLNSLTAGLLDQGTAKRSAPQIAEALDFLGADFNQSAGSDFTTLTSTGLSPSRDRVLELFSEIILTPAFNRTEIQRRTAVVLASIRKSEDQPSVFADQASDREIFGDHPYAVPAVGTLNSIKSLRRTDFMRHYFAYYRPNNSILAVVGNIEPEFQDKVRAAFKKWTRAEIRRPERKSAALKSARVALLHKEGLQQTQIRMGHVGIPRSNSDFMALRMANVILGGAFASRLNQKVRDDLGLTYSIHSVSDARLEPGSFEISTFTRHEKVADTLRETQALLQHFVKEGVTDAEMEAAKALLIGQFPAALETPDRLAFNLMVLRRYGISDDYLRNFQSNVRAMTRDQVNSAIRRHIHPEKMQVLIYSDENAVREQITKMGTVERVKFP